jgi:hypothetical protein
MIRNENNSWSRARDSIVLCATAYLFLQGVSGPATAAENVIDLRRAGWVVVGKEGRLEQRPGQPPYRTRQRVVHVTTFVMEKDGRRKVCTLAYDSQLDSFDEKCRDPE